MADHTRVVIPQLPPACPLPLAHCKKGWPASHAAGHAGQRGAAAIAIRRLPRMMRGAVLVHRITSRHGRGHALCAMRCSVATGRTTLCRAAAAAVCWLLTCVALVRHTITMHVVRVRRPRCKQHKTSRSCSSSSSILAGRGRPSAAAHAVLPAARDEGGWVSAAWLESPAQKSAVACGQSGCAMGTGASWRHTSSVDVVLDRGLAERCGWKAR